MFSDLAFSFLKTAFLSEKGSDAMAEKIFTEILRARERETQGVNDNKNRTLPERKGGEKYGWNRKMILFYWRVKDLRWSDENDLGVIHTKNLALGTDGGLLLSLE